MHFPELEAYQTKHPTLSESIRSLDTYLYDLLSSSQERDISPPLVAKKLGVEEAIALVLLMFAHEAGIITPQYYVYCPATEDFLASYPSLKDLPDTISCPYDEKQHRSNEYFTELTFRFSIKAQSWPVVSAA